MKKPRLLFTGKKRQTKKQILLWLLHVFQKKKRIYYTNPKKRNQKTKKKTKLKITPSQ